MSTIQTLSALEILDSRGRPTVQATCILADGSTGAASVPSGASTGRAEALELRDGDPARYGGLGCRRAVAHVNGEIAEALAGQDFDDQQALDEALIALDGTPNKSRLGANAILAASLAFARSQATQRNVPLYTHFADILDGKQNQQNPREIGPLPPWGRAGEGFLTINLFSGGKHAGGQVAIQDVLVVPHAPTIDEGLATTYAVYQAAASLIAEKYNMRALTADEGGLAPPFADVESMLGDAVESIERAGFTPGKEVSLAIDVASSHFFTDGKYLLGNEKLDGYGMIDAIATWCDAYPIISVEDGLAEDDWSHWPRLREALSGQAITLGDDLLCTNSTRIQRAIDEGAADALLLKVNQIGTLSEAADACRLARSAGWRVVVSARSGETEDDWLADLAVGWGGDYIKVGSINQSERLAKYNRLLAIEAEINEE